MINSLKRSHREMDLKKRLCLLAYFGWITVFHASTTSARHIEDSFIVGGGVVKSDETYPFVCSVEYNGAHKCACALIHKYFVVTAAHCVSSGVIGGYKVVLGVYDRFRTEIYGQAEWYGIESIEKHYWFDTVGRSKVADIALLYLVSEANFKNNFISKIRLPHPNDDYIGQTCTLLGWGKINPGIWEPHQDKLREANMTVLTNQVCSTQHEGEVINRSHICTTGKGSISACGGDQGGPLICKNAGDWYLAGVHSWFGANCAITKPSVFTNVAFFRDWIDEVTGWRN